jgi:4a-hydroxytetrahydrobiopterin dehydratase
MSTDANACGLPTQDLVGKKCVPCEGGVPSLTLAESQALGKQTPAWTITTEGVLKIRREWTAKHFKAALEFVNAVAALAEAEQHHPDIHLTGYRQVTLELYTHAIGGLSENDFILAAKIDQLPIRLKAVN